MKKINKIKNKFKNKKSLFFLLPIFLVLVIGVTWALFSSSYGFNNKFNIANYDVQIEENFEGTWGTKEVSIVNKEQTPVVIRVSYNEMMRLEQEDGSNIYLGNRVKAEDEYVDVVTKGWTEAWINDFVLGNDGWYYYKKVLTEAGGTNERVHILETIELNEEAIKFSPKYDDYLKALYELDFNFEAVQASSNAVKSLWGESVDSVKINKDNTVEWTLKTKIPGGI